MGFDTTKSPQELVSRFISTSRDSLNVEVRNVQGSGHDCLAYFTNGHSTDTTGEEGGTIGHIEGQHILSNEGIVLSTGKPQHFYHDTTTSTSTTANGQTAPLNNNWGDAISTNWYASGDGDLDTFLKRPRKKNKRQGGKNQQGISAGGSGIGSGGYNPFVRTYDACKLEFEFRCLDDGNLDGFLGSSTTISTTNNDATNEGGDARVSFTYNFASEEYYEQYSALNFGDAFGFFLNGENIATLPPSSTTSSSSSTGGDGTTTFVGIDTVNQESNSQYFVGNDVSSKEGIQYPTIEADGLTVQLVASGLVNAVNVNTADDSSSGGGGWNTMKIVIADVGDRMLDSWVLLKGDSLKCERVVVGEENAEQASSSTQQQGVQSRPPRPPILTEDTSVSMQYVTSKPTMKPTPMLPTSNNIMPTRPTTSSSTFVTFDTSTSFQIMQEEDTDNNIAPITQVGAASWWKTPNPTPLPTSSPMVLVEEATGQPTSGLTIFAETYKPTASSAPSESGAPSKTSVPSGSPTEMSCSKFIP
jgi:hypothetical protein